VLVQLEVGDGAVDVTVPHDLVCLQVGGPLEDCQVGLVNSEKLAALLSEGEHVKVLLSAAVLHSFVSAMGCVANLV